MGSPERQQERRPPRRSAARRRTRLARGPLTIGEPAPDVEVRLAASEPYRPDLVADGGGALGLTVRAASVRGLYKRYLGTARQDDLCLAVHEPTETVIAAVADGVSSAARSDVGAALAVRHATSTVQRQLDGGSELAWDEVFANAAWALVEEQRRADADAAASVVEAAESLATTLLLAVIHVDPDREEVRAELGAVGDSPGLLLSEGNFRTLVGELERPGELLGGGVKSLPRIARPVARCTCELARGEVLLLCTDGLALPLAGGQGEVGRTLARELARPPDIADFARLLDFSRSTYDDDRTLIAIWPQR